MKIRCHRELSPLFLLAVVRRRPYRENISPMVDAIQVAWPILPCSEPAVGDRLVVAGHCRRAMPPGRSAWRRTTDLQVWCRRRL